MTTRSGVFVLLAGLAVATVGCSGTASDDPAYSSRASETSSSTTTEPSATQEEIEGVWYLESFEVDGVEETVEIGLNTARQPWIDLRNPYLTGNLGCNDLGGTDDTYTLVDGVLKTKAGGVFQTAAFCVNEGEDPADEDAVMVVEEAFAGIFYPEGVDGIQVDVEGDQMVWTAGNTTLIFSKAEAPPSG